MTAKVEIIVEEIEDTVFVPVQSIFVEEDDHFCYVSIDGEVEKRHVIVGQFNDEFIEIEKGLGEGEAVFLSEPDGIDREDEVETLPDAETLAGVPPVSR